VDADAAATGDAAAATDLSIAAADVLAAGEGDDDLPVGLVVAAALLALAVTGATALTWRRRPAA
jgi:hypothetical protein